MTIRICVWSGPRNISTALMYSFAQRADTVVVDEPLYAHYLSQTDARSYHPGADEIIASMDNDWRKVVTNVILAPVDAPVIFFKMMTHHLVHMDWAFMRETVNVLLTRDPHDMLPSYARNVAAPRLVDTGYAEHITLLKYLRAAGQSPPVLESRTLLRNPPLVLARLCEAIGIPFDPAMLAWPPGPRPEDGVWARHWYANVHASTGFQPYRPRQAPFPEPLRPLLDECLPYYKQLAALAIPAS